MRTSQDGEHTRGLNGNRLNAAFCESILRLHCFFFLKRIMDIFNIGQIQAKLKSSLQFIVIRVTTILIWKAAQVISEFILCIVLRYDRSDCLVF